MALFTVLSPSSHEHGSEYHTGLCGTGDAWQQRKKGCGLALGSFWRNLSRGCFGLGLGIHEEEVPSLLLWSSKGDRCIAGLGLPCKCHSGECEELKESFREEETELSQTWV